MDPNSVFIEEDVPEPLSTLLTPRIQCRELSTQGSTSVSSHPSPDPASKRQWQHQGIKGGRGKQTKGTSVRNLAIGVS